MSNDPGACDNCGCFVDCGNRCAGCGGEFCDNCSQPDGRGFPWCDVCRDHPSDDEEECEDAK